MRPGRIKPFAQIGAALAVLTSATALAQDVGPGRTRLTAPMVDAVCARRLSRVRSCYKTAVGKTPGLFGVVAIGIKVGSDGHSGERWIAMSTVADPELEGCALKAFEGLVFPAPGDNGVEVRYGMLLSVEVKKKTDKNTELPDRGKLEEEAWRKSLGLGNQGT